MSNLMGFDIGTSSTKCILIDRSGRLIASSSKEYGMGTPNPGRTVFSRA
jgi:sugar (pentulose or hexulose) kinase